MYLTCQQPYINFDHLVDINALMSIKPLISAFIAKHFYLVKPTNLYASNIDTGEQGILDYLGQYKENLQNLCDSDLQPVVQNLIDTGDFGKWIMFEKDVATSNFTIQLRPSTEYKSKHLSALCNPIREDKKFSFFYQWLDAQNIFQEYGRVVSYINFQHTFTKMHVDYHDSKNLNSDEFIWLGFSKHKNLYIYDESTKTKTYVQGTCNWFNTGNWHGTDPSEQSCYSIRVDGVFSKEFKQKFSNPHLVQ